MGWKSTIDMTRQEMEEAVQSYCDVENLSDEQLSDLLETLRGGEDHGYNYRIVNNKDKDN